MSSIIVGLLVLLFFAVILVFAFCYKIPQVLQVLLMRTMLNKVTERNYVSKIRRLKDGLARIRIPGGKQNDANNEQ